MTTDTINTIAGKSASLAASPAKDPTANGLAIKPAKGWYFTCAWIGRLGEQYFFAAESLEAARELAREKLTRYGSVAHIGFDGQPWEQYHNLGKKWGSNDVRWMRAESK